MFNAPQIPSSPQISSTRWQRFKQAVARRMRDLVPKSASRPVKNAPDFGSVMALAVFLVGSTLWASYAPPPPSRAGEMRAGTDPALHAFTNATQTATVYTPPVRCAGSVDTIVRTQACSPQERLAWLWAAPNLQRHVMGEPMCWWYADVQDLASLSGITEAWAERVVMARDVEGKYVKRLPAELIDSIGPHRVKVLTKHVSLDCALVPRDTQARAAAALR